MNNKIIGVILAAGKGTRMSPFTSRYPKPILTICNKPILFYQIEMMKQIGIETFIIVIGHLGHEIAQTCGDGSQWGVKIRYIEQQETLGIAHAVGKLEPYITSAFLLSLGDIFFLSNGLDKMFNRLKQNNAGAVLAVKREKDPNATKRNFSVIQDDSGRVRRVIEKPRYITNNLKGCGLYLFDQCVFDAIRRTPRTAMRDEYEITDTIQILVDDDLPVFAEEVIQWDMNVTFPRDVLDCNLIQLKRINQPSVIGQSVNIHPDAVIENSVIGDHVHIESPILIKDSVVFPHTTVSSQSDIHRFILTPNHSIDCRTLNMEQE